jgi:O-antigen ligase
MSNNGTRRQSLDLRSGFNLEAGSELSADGTAPSWLVYLIILTVWLQPLATGNGFPPIGTLALGFASLALLFELMVRRASLSNSLAAPVVLCYLAIVWVTAGALIAGIPIARVYDWITIALPIVLGTWVAGDIRTGRRLLRASFVAMALWVSAVTLQAFVSPSLFGLTTTYGSERVTGLHYNANGGATFLLMGTLLMLAAALHPSSTDRHRLTYGVMALAGIWSVVATGSRGALVALSAGLALLLILRASKSLRTGRTYLQALAALGVGALGSYLLPMVSERVLDRETTVYELEASRSQVWGNAMAAIEESPVFGVVDISFEGGLENAHNAFLEACLRYGVFVGVILGILLAVLLIRSWRAQHSQDEDARPYCALAVGVGLVVYGMTHASIVDNSFLWLVLGGFSGVRYGSSARSLKNKKIRGIG